MQELKKYIKKEWLNSEFIGRAFNDDERARILETTNYNFDNPKYNTGENRYVLVKDNNKNYYYSVKITFKKTTHYDKEKYYPLFSNSTLLK